MGISRPGVVLRMDEATLFCFVSCWRKGGGLETGEREGLELTAHRAANSLEGWSHWGKRAVVEP